LGGDFPKKPWENHGKLEENPWFEGRFFMEIPKGIMGI